MNQLIPRLSWDHPVAVAMAFVASLLLGTIAWTRIPLQMLPDGFEPKFLYVVVPYPNGTPVETDERVVRPVVDQLATVPGVKSLVTDASAGEATFEIEFQPSVKMEAAYGDVADRLERAMPELPADVERWFVFKFDPDDAPILWAGLQIPPEVPDEWTLMTQIVQPRIERVPGVARIDLWGASQKGVWIDWDKDHLAATGTNLGEVVPLLMRDNFQRPAGRITDHGRVLQIRSVGWIPDLEALRSWPIPSSRGAHTLGDVADIQLRKALSASIGRINGNEAASIGVSRESSANTVQAAHDVREAMADLERDPRLFGAKFFVFFDQGELVEGSLDTLVRATLEGGVFAVLILLLFLREWRMTLLVALSIPVSLLLTVAVLYVRGDSLNLLSLMGLMLSVGMVVDMAVVVVETIQQHRSRGSEPRKAAIEGTGEVSLAIVTSTVASMIVFLPVILMSGDAEFSFFMGALGYPVVFAHAASLGVALFFAPLATRLVGHMEPRPDARWLAWLTNRYESLLRRVLRNPFDAGAAAVAMFLLTIIVPMRSVECSGEPAQDVEDFTIRFSVPPQANYAERDAIVKEFEGYVESHRKDWGVDVYRVRLPGDEHEGRLTVHLKDPPLEFAEVVKAAKEGLPKDLAGVSARIGWEGEAAEQRSIAVTLRGDDMDVLTGLAREVARRAETVDGVLGARFGWAEGGAPEVQLRVRKDDVERQGTSGQVIGQTVAYAMRGASLEPLRQGEREVPVTTRFALEDRSDVRALEDFPIGTPNGIVPLRSLVDVGIGHGPSVVHREDGRTAVTVNVDLADGVEPDGIAEGVDAALDGMVMPVGYGLDSDVGWDAAAGEDSARNLAMLLSIAFVFLVMGMLFESLLLPLAIITTVPMAMMGAWWALWLLDTPMDLMAGIGLVILVGVVVNNGIVLIDVVGQLRSEGNSREEALVIAGRRRLRPILMTALCTIMGLVPMAFGSQTFIGIPYAPLGQAVMGGMVAGTLLTLLYVPWVYAMLDDVRDALYSALSATRAPRAQP